jgi:hypothetical protein
VELKYVLHLFPGTNTLGSFFSDHYRPTSEEPASIIHLRRGVSRLESIACPKTGVAWVANSTK